MLTLPHIKTPLDIKTFLRPKSQPKTSTKTNRIPPPTPRQNPHTEKKKKIEDKNITQLINAAKHILVNNLLSKENATAIIEEFNNDFVGAVMSLYYYDQTKSPTKESSLSETESLSETDESDSDNGYSDEEGGEESDSDNSYYQTDEERGEEEEDIWLEINPIEEIEKLAKNAAKDILRRKTEKANKDILKREQQERLSIDKIKILAKNAAKDILKRKQQATKRKTEKEDLLKDLLESSVPPATTHLLSTPHRDQEKEDLLKDLLESSVPPTTTHSSSTPHRDQKKEDLLKDLLESSVPPTTTHSSSTPHRDQEKEDLLQQLLESSVPPTTTHSSSTPHRDQEKEDLLQQLLESPIPFVTAPNHGSKTSTFDLKLGRSCPFKLEQQVAGNLGFFSATDSCEDNIEELVHCSYSTWERRRSAAGRYTSGIWLTPGPGPPYQPTSWNIKKDGEIQQYIPSTRNPTTGDDWVHGTFKGIDEKGLYIIQTTRVGTLDPIYIYFKPNMVVASHTFLFKIGERVIYWDGNQWKKAKIVTQNLNNTYNIGFEDNSVKVNVKEGDLFMDLPTPKGPLKEINETLKKIVEQLSRGVVQDTRIEALKNRAIAQNGIIKGGITRTRSTTIPKNI